MHAYKQDPALLICMHVGQYMHAWFACIIDRQSGVRLQSTKLAHTDLEAAAAGSPHTLHAT